MTRENKLALVVGFALIVFVGVLVSDHFSAARLDKPANLAQRDGRSTQRSFRDGELIDLDQQNVAAKNSKPVARPALNTSQYKQEVSGNSQQRQEKNKKVQPYAIRLPDLQDDSLTISPDTKKSILKKISYKVRSVVVKNNESLSRICQREYQDGSLAAALAEYNGIADPNMVHAGIRLRLPDPSFFGIIDKPQASTAKDKYAHYTVKKGETLSEISQKLLKTFRRWQELYELNKDVIDDPNNVRSGITLKIPTT